MLLLHLALSFATIAAHELARPMMVDAATTANKSPRAFGGFCEWIPFSDRLQMWCLASLCSTLHVHIIRGKVVMEPVAINCNENYWCMGDKRSKVASPLAACRSGLGQFGSRCRRLQGIDQHIQTRQQWPQVLLLLAVCVDRFGTTYVPLQVKHQHL